MFNILTQNLIKLGYTVSCFKTSKEASIYINSKIDRQTVGFGGSISLAQMGLYNTLGEHNIVYWHQGIADKEESKEMRIKANNTTIYISSVNAIAETGEIINIDGNCNRVASIFYGHEKVYFVVGNNKIEQDYDSALYRARNIAAPLNAKRLGVKTPCAIKAERCYDCNSPERICRGLSVLWGKPMTGEFEVILIDEALGY